MHFFIHFYLVVFFTSIDVCTIEFFFKKDLPHTHILVWLVSKFKCRIADDVDSIVLIEIPDMNIDPLCHEIISKFMIHVPCDVVKSNAQCMLEGRCAKSFPKKFKDSIVFCKNRFVYCKRRECHDNFVLNDGIMFCNDYIVLYNKELLMRYNAHTYIEICCQSILIKYLFKYVNKRPDRCCMVLQNESNGEIQTYLNCRFIFLYEAF